MGAKILVVEDETASNILAARQVKALGYEVVCAFDGLEALQKIKDDQDIRVILTDCYMPKLDGFELNAALRANEKSRHITCILLSADQKLRYKARDNHFFAWIRKPMQLEHLKAVLLHPALVTGEIKS